MANICETRVVVHGEIDALNRLHQAIKDEENNGGNLLNIWGRLTHSLDNVETERGEVVYFEEPNKEDGTLAFTVESAWTQPTEFFREVERYLNVRINYFAFECGCDICQKEDADGDFPFNYYVDDMENGANEAEDFDGLLAIYKNEISEKQYAFLEKYRSVKRLQNAVNHNRDKEGKEHIFIHEVEEVEF